MTVSEAIRLSIGLVRDDRGCFLSQWPDPCGCAIGTAMYSVGRRTLLTPRDFCLEWPWVEGLASHPETGARWPVVAIINSLHLMFGWSRERIADHVEAIDPTMPLPRPIEQVHEVSL